MSTLAHGLAPHPVRDHCLAPSRDAETVGQGRYGRLFGDLPALTAGEEVFRGHGRTAVAGDDSPFVDSADDDEGAGCEAAGWPFFAQFVAHDLTADRSVLVSRADVASLANARGARVNLECVYGRGPSDQPYLYQREDPARLLLGLVDGGDPRDIPRNREGLPIVADQRNDVHVPIGQLHVAFLHAHNGIVDRLREDGVPEEDLFAAAQRALRWHYQWIVLHDFLPRLLGPERARAVREARTLYEAGDDPQVPVEFADAAYRYGHSQIRERYRLNARMEPTRLFPDLVGLRAVPAWAVADWEELFDLPGRPPAAQRARRIDGRLVPSLIRLPFEITGALTDVEFQSLAVRDLQRGLATGLPSGEDVARALGLEPLAREQIGVDGLGWEWETPLWFYVLKEAEVHERGERLGPVGGQIVGEVLAGVVDADPTSFRSVEPGWTPTLPAAGESFGLGDLLLFADRARGAG
jgi:hypothetical protein